MATTNSRITGVPDPGSTSTGVLAKLSRSQRLLSAPWLLSQWVPSALGGTIVGANDTANGSYAGGEIFTLTQTTTAGPRNTMQTVDRLFVPAVGNNDPWFITFELSADLGQFVTVSASDAVSTNLFTIQVGAPNNRIQMFCAGGTTLTVDPVAFSQAQWHRITAVCTPATSTTGTIRYFAHWTSTATSTEVRQFLGSHTYSTSAIVTRVIVTQSWVATGVVRFARLVVAEMFGVTNGSSLDAGYVGWAASPHTARTFAASSYNFRRNPAWLLAQRIAGDGDWFVNHARGGHAVADMSAEYADFVLALSPRLICLGSATNSINAAVALGADPATTAALTADKATYRAMCVDGLAAGAVVIATGVAPRHDTVPALNLARWASFAQDWNAWMQSALVPLGVKVAPVWSALEDPATPGQLVAWANAGDNVHFSWRGQKTVADIQYSALFS